MADNDVDDTVMDSVTVVTFHHDPHDENSEGIESSRARDEPVLALFGDGSVLAAVRDALRGKRAGQDHANPLRRPGRLRHWRPGLALLVMTLTVGACAQNPVTGRKELLLVSEDWELSVGRQQYAPLRQAQGGDYVVDPGVEAYVRQVGMRLAAKSDRKLPYEFNVINDSTPNAWALPGGKISINRGLLTELNNEAELAAVLGHEIVHAAAKHGARGATRGIGLQLAVITATVAGSRKGYGQLAQLGSTIGAQIVNSRYGRSAELESDLYGMRYMARAGYDPVGAVKLQQTFVRLSEGRRQDFLSGLFASHPPSRQRVEANVETAASLPPGGEIGVDRYRKAMARLKAKQPAYERFDRAQKLASDGKTKQAEALVREAIEIEPREGHFASFLGDMAQKRRNYDQARRHYDQAIALNSDFFYYWLQRGKVNQAQRKSRAARADFARSVKLMPTADAQAALGAIALAEGRKSEAERWYAMAAQAGGKSGDQARAALAKLSPPADARNFAQVRHGLSPDGNLVFQIINQTSRPLASVQLGVRLAPGAEQKTSTVRRLIPPGKNVVINTGRPFTRSQVGGVRFVVLGAEFAN